MQEPRLRAGGKGPATFFEKSKYVEYHHALFGSDVGKRVESGSGARAKRQTDTVRRARKDGDHQQIPDI